MALGQLADYSRFLVSDVERAVLLPEKPRRDLEVLLSSQNVSCVWPQGRGFTDNADGKFV
jgi:hypothetical protein